ncbi:hypothetical protein RMONA_06350 [Rickettsia monacensis]|uniref:Uncharacterized protein n=1 Tax=Rickettsia monacensis TaxID=109232 RepID=A0A0B7J5L8_9RICK|nr:hypothetical protein [Rickettsia monacensis]CDI30044.1 hypothetical protein RMONA_7050 [Rickettsia monacensis IrR/Munich]CEO17629.1 hypothetical protein RMONA_06350 [Rickettsia monacensis]
MELVYISTKSFINSLISLKDISSTPPVSHGVAMLESTKEKILQIIKSSKILSILAHNPSELLSYKDEDIVTVKDLALKRFCFLVANNEKLEISKDSEAETLLKVISFNNSNYDIYNNLKKYLVEECKTYENFKKILDTFSDKIREIIKFEDKLVSNPDY